MEAASFDARRVLYISYNGMLEPLGQSQVIPYLKELSKLGVRFWLLSFERPPAFALGGAENVARLRADLAEWGIEWHVLRYHRKPSLPATAYDVARGVRFAGRLVEQNKIEMVHARAHIPAVIALALKKRFGTRLIFDVRGLMAEEYIDAGHWKASGIPARVTKSSEARVLRAADGIVTLTAALWDEIQSWPSLAGRTVAHETIPCCIDLEKFRFDPAQRAAVRSEFGVDDRLVLVYSGSIGGWYMTDEMAAFFQVLKQERRDAFFLWLTHGPPSLIEGAMTGSGLKPADYAVRKIEPVAMASFLSAADAGIAFYRPGISRLGTSPVKVSEYLACGLPIVINRGIGDSDSLAQEHKIAAMVRDFNPAEYATAAEDLQRMTADPENTRRRTREVAERLFDVSGLGLDRYARLYEKVLGEGIAV